VVSTLDLISSPDKVEKADEKAPQKGKASAKIEEDKSGLTPTPLFDQPTRPRPTKGEALKRADGLADGFILLDLTGAGVEDGWHWVIDGKDEPTIRESALGLSTHDNIGRLTR
jgi:superkiller protein 3